MAYNTNMANSPLENGSAKPIPTAPLSLNQTRRQERYTSPTATIFRVLTTLSDFKFHPGKPIFLPGGPPGGRRLNDIIFGTKIADGWTEYIHPDGKLYFHHQKWRVVTEANLRNTEVAEKVERAYLALIEMWNEFKAQKPSLSAVSEDWLEIYIGLGPEVQYYYYFVNHQTQEVFWLTKIRRGEGFLGPMDTKSEGASYDPLIRHQYYAHLAAFPCHNEAPEDGIQFLLEFLEYVCADDLTTDFKVAPWDPPQARSLLSYLDVLLNKRTGPTTNGFKTCCIARLLVATYGSRAANYHATLRAINDRPTFPPPELARPHFLLSLLYFFGNAAYKDRWSKVLAGKTVSDAQWRGLIESFKEEWSQSTLLAAVLLIPEVIFLSLGGLSVAARTCGILAVFFALGTLVTGPPLVPMHRHSLQYSGLEAVHRLYQEYFLNTRQLPTLLVSSRPPTPTVPVELGLDYMRIGEPGFQPSQVDLGTPILFDRWKGPFIAVLPFGGYGFELRNHPGRRPIKSTLDVQVRMERKKPTFLPRLVPHLFKRSQPPKSKRRRKKRKYGPSPLKDQAFLYVCDVQVGLEGNEPEASTRSLRNTRACTPVRKAFHSPAPPWISADPVVKFFTVVYRQDPSRAATAFDDYRRAHPDWAGKLLAVLAFGNREEKLLENFLFWDTFVRDDDAAVEMFGRAVETIHTSPRLRPTNHPLLTGLIVIAALSTCRVVLDGACKLIGSIWFWPSFANGAVVPLVAAGKV
ncbi:unnamed protein product [Cyclocybe aegerita]|uniref:WW domain-containing protein n=1 Tax=Cyclocybe aegerita TaxID=1973307 RepID=A0A8S0X7I5_CYCAE|nr:unnamed protein product [Cyclocybe aegerita]